MTEAANPKPHAAYVERLRRRLAQPSISVIDARDGVLDCFVATYQEGLAAGMRGIVGIDAGPEHVARIAESIFRRRLEERGATFDQPSVEALAAVKEEADAELHFDALPAELQVTHDRVCELLLAKAEGSLPHAGDHSAIVGGAVDSRSSAPTAFAPVVREAPSRASRSESGASPPMRSLREAVASLFEDLASRARSEVAMSEVKARLEKAMRLVETVQELESE